MYALLLYYSSTLEQQLLTAVVVVAAATAAAVVVVVVVVVVVLVMAVEGNGRSLKNSKILIIASLRFHCILLPCPYRRNCFTTLF